MGAKVEHLPQVDAPDAHSAPSVTDTQRVLYRNADKRMRRMMLPLLTPEEVEFAGIRMRVDPRDNYTDRRIWLNGQPPEMKSLVSLCEMVEGKNAYVLDIGANCGAFAVPLGMACGAGSRVVAFEPNPVMIGRLGHNIQLNGLNDRVRIEGCALGAEPGEATLNFRARNFGQASLIPVAEGARSGSALVPVRVITDYIAAAQNHDVCVIKIDVEGAEEAALGPLLDAARGGGWMPDALLMETAHADLWASDLVAQVTALGFTPSRRIEGNTLFVRQDGS